MDYKGYFKIQDGHGNVLYLRNDFEVVSFRADDGDDNIYVSFLTNVSQESFCINKKELERILHYIRKRDNIKDF